MVIGPHKFVIMDVIGQHMFVIVHAIGPRKFGPYLRIRAAFATSRTRRQMHVQRRA